MKSMRTAHRSVLGALALWVCLWPRPAVRAGAAAPQAPAAPASGGPVAPRNTLDPEALVEDSAQAHARGARREPPMYAKDPAKLDALVANVLLPNFDSEYAARLVLGQTWRTATPEQRKRFVDAFYHSCCAITATRC